MHPDTIFDKLTEEQKAVLREVVISIVETDPDRSPKIKQIAADLAEVMLLLA